jgi:hypothetical protein
MHSISGILLFLRFKSIYMRKLVFIAISVALLIIAGCKDTDNASKWVGTYKATSGGLANSTFSQIVVSESNGNTIKMQLDTVLPPTFLTYVTLQNVSLQSSTSGTINETDAVFGVSQPMLITGTTTLNGNILTVTGKAANSTDSVLFYFYGTKQ